MSHHYFHFRATAFVSMIYLGPLKCDFETSCSVTQVMTVNIVIFIIFSYSSDCLEQFVSAPIIWKFRATYFSICPAAEPLCIGENNPDLMPSDTSCVWCWGCFLDSFPWSLGLFLILPSEHKLGSLKSWSFFYQTDVKIRGISMIILYFNNK